VTDLFTSAEKPTAPPEPFTVSQVSKRIHDLLDGRIGRVDVIGQMNSPNFGKHWYFTLTDGDAKIDCAMWASSVSKHRATGGSWVPSQGDQVVVRGRVGHYAKFGKTQIYVERIKPAGETKGRLQLEYEALLLEFREAGWFDECHKKQLPEYPRRIAVITSGTSAAMHDVIETTRRRMPSVELLIVNALMQGDGSPDSVSEAIRKVDANAKSMGIDAVIVTRGGGGLEELWSFNDRRVVEAAFKCNTPIVVAIGHESDTTIIELVADHRASTPTQAVMVLVPDRDELMQMVEHYGVRLQSMVDRSLEYKLTTCSHASEKLQLSVASFLHTLAMRLATQTEKLTAKRPHALLQARQRILLTLQSSLSATTTRFLSHRANIFEGLRSRLDSIGPMKVLNRGYTLTQDSSGKVVRSVKDVKEGTQIRTVLPDGTIESEVKCVHE
jgi:exodeoxyribonuclease VII large subunit